MPSGQSDPLEQRVLLLTPTQRDGELACAMLAEAGVAADSCRDVVALGVELQRPVGAVMLPEESLSQGGMQLLVSWLGRQEPWSDLPILLLVRAGANSATAEEAVSRLGNVTLLERPLRVATLLSAVRTALRARRRQYQIREHLQDRARSNDLLESRVAERTAVAEQRAAQLGMLASELSQAETRERRRLAGILHDHLQQLLVAARLSLGLALSRAGDDATRAPIRRADDLINESIEESRSLTVELSPPILYEGGLIAALAWLGRWIGEKHGLSVDVRCDPDADPPGEDTRVLLFQAARELLFNVVKHAGVTQATLTLTRRSDGGPLLRVEDAGRGFDAGLDDADGGDHFGLFNIRERVNLLGGAMGVWSDVDRGTSVSVELPPSGAAAGAPIGGEPDAEQPPQPVEGPRGSVRRDPGRTAVLLADDHVILREGLAGLLREESDIEVVGQAADGRQAVELAERLQPDVVVMDVTMPVLTGVEATRQITERLPGVRVIALSMHDQSEMAAAMREAGAAAYLTKGGPMDRLIECIRNCVVAKPGKPALGGG